MSLVAQGIHKSLIAYSQNRSKSNIYLIRSWHSVGSFLIEEGEWDHLPHIYCILGAHVMHTTITPGLLWLERGDAEERQTAMVWRCAA